MGKPLVRECKQNRHVKRDNTFGITWCIRCGQLFISSVGKEITDQERLDFKIPKLYITTPSNS
jgi:hypothetical protein